MKILVIGGTGHVGTFLVPKLVAAGHEVYIGTRGITKLKDANSFVDVKFISCDTSKAECLQELKKYQFDTIVDFPGTAYRVWEALKNDISHLVVCGSIWMYGYPHVVPTPEGESKEECPFNVYNIRYQQIKQMIDEAEQCKADVTAIMLPNICGPGKVPIDQYGGRNLQYHKDMQKGKKVYIPDGPECLIGPCDADDIADLFTLVINNRVVGANQMFNAGASYSIPISDFVKAYGDIYGVELPIEKVSWGKYVKEINPDVGGWWHFYTHMLPDITKAKALLGYTPKYTPEASMRRAVEWMYAENLLAKE